MIEVDDASVGQRIDRLLVIGVDWTQSPQDGANKLEALLAGQRYAGHLEFVAQGTPTNNTGGGRSGSDQRPRTRTLARPDQPTARRRRMERRATARGRARAGG